MALPQLGLRLAPARAPAQLLSAGPTVPLSRPGSVDSLIADAGVELAHGRSWKASRMMALVVEDSSLRTPAAVLLAAEAASQWGGWPEVTRLLAGEPWLDTMFRGQGRMLLARAALEQGLDSVALGSAVAATKIPGRFDDGERLFLLATALDRVGARDSASATYQQAAERLPLIADWLRIRAASLTDDSLAREQLYARITGDLPRQRIGWAEAAAHERTGDLDGAARRYAELGERILAFRLRVALTRDSAQRATVRQELLQFTAGPAGAREAREAIAILDSVFAPLQPWEELTVARAAGQSGLASRAAAGYERALGAGVGTSEDRFGLATALTKLGRDAEAAFQFTLVTEPRQLAASAAYQGARAMVRSGQLAEGRSALVEIPKRFSRDTVAASSALFLLADLAIDDRADAAARTYYLRLAKRYPSSRFAPAARFRAAMIALVSHKRKRAAREFDEVAKRYPQNEEFLAAVYWAGRAWAATGDSLTARARWQRVAASDPLSYYASLATRRLGLPEWAPPEAADSFTIVPAFDSAFARAALLSRLGMSAESRWEYDSLARISDTSSERLLAVANALRDQGLASQAIQLARRALARGAPADGRTYRLLYPVTHEDAVLAEAAEQRLDPTFLAALVRQESMFNSGATSSVGARGLMQVMPELGERLARTLNFPVWDPVLLYQPDVSIQLGSFHLRELADRYRRPADILAAYNAGMSRVERWSKRIGGEDPEVFAERIPFTETRGYVRVIQRNQEIYRMLYAWPVALTNAGEIDSLPPPPSMEAVIKPM
jgi:soluble lytic murein transglycosylase-like protein/TolA-binding protein